MFEEVEVLTRQTIDDHIAHTDETTQKLQKKARGGMSMEKTEYRRDSYENSCEDEGEDERRTAEMVVGRTKGEEEKEGEGEKANEEGLLGGGGTHHQSKSRRECVVMLESMRIKGARSSGN